MQWIRIGYNHDTSRNLEIWLYFLKKFQLGFSSKIKVPQLGSTRLDSARKFHSSGSLEPENSSSNSSLENKKRKPSKIQENIRNGPIKIYHRILKEEIACT